MLLVFTFESVVFFMLARKQANEGGPPTLVGTWEKPVRQLYLEFLDSPKNRKIPDAEVRARTTFYPSVLPRSPAACTLAHKNVLPLQMFHPVTWLLLARIALFNSWAGIPRQMAEIGSILGTTGSMGVSLKRETPPWTSMEVEIEFQGNWLHCTEAYDKWWEKQVYSISNLVFSLLLVHCGVATRDKSSCTRACVCVYYCRT